MRTSTGTACNRGLATPTDTTLCRPGFVEVDSQGNVFVSDHWLEIAGNRRLLVFDGTLFAGQPSSPIIAPAAAALRFPLGHPAVAAVLAGARSSAEQARNLDMARQPIPADLWAELKAEGLLVADAPTP